MGFENGFWHERRQVAPIKDLPSSRCRRCHALIVFVPVRFGPRDRGKNHPLDRDPRPDGDIYQSDQTGLCWLVPSGAGEFKRYLARYGTKFYKSHFDTCPNAQEFRR